MTTPCRAAVLALAFLLPCIAQKNWTDRAEYDLFTSINEEADAAQQIALLYEWEAEYPDTEFQRERLLLLLSAYRKIGRTAEAFTTAVQLRDLSKYDSAGLHWIVTIGPTLPQPSQEDIETIAAAANKLLLPRPVVTVTGITDPLEPGRVIPVAASPTPVKPSPPPDPAQEAESQKVDSLIQDMRRKYRAQPPPPDPVVVQRAAAEAALAWIRSLKR
jgi:hypothetical protein